MHGARGLSIGEDRLRIAPWRGDPRTAYVVARYGRPSTWALACCVEQLGARGYDSVLTTALPAAEQAPYLANGFTVHERLHLLARPVDPVPEEQRHRARAASGPSSRPRRGARAWTAPPSPRSGDSTGRASTTLWPPRRASATGWRGSAASVDDLVGYAVTGRSGPRGYLQRLAVHPDAQRSGVGSALVVDALRWLRRWGAREVLVNTQEDNGAAIALYEQLGFRRQDEGLAVLQRPIARPGP